MSSTLATLTNNTLKQSSCPLWSSTGNVVPLSLLDTIVENSTMSLNDDQEGELMGFVEWHGILGWVRDCCILHGFFPYTSINYPHLRRGPDVFVTVGNSCQPHSYADTLDNSSAVVFLMPLVGLSFGWIRSNKITLNFKTSVVKASRWFEELKSS